MLIQVILDKTPSMITAAAQSAKRMDCAYFLVVDQDGSIALIKKYALKSQVCIKIRVYGSLSIFRCSVEDYGTWGGGGGGDIWV